MQCAAAATRVFNVFAFCARRALVQEMRENSERKQTHTRTACERARQGQWNARDCVFAAALAVIETHTWRARARARSLALTMFILLTL